jgi:hypothetical protein
MPSFGGSRVELKFGQVGLVVQRWETRRVEHLRF